MLLAKIVNKKTKAFFEGTNALNYLQNDLFSWSISGIPAELRNKFIGKNVLDVTKFIYDSEFFKIYLQYSFLGKYYEKKISFVRSLVTLFFVLLGVALYFLIGFNFLFVILLIILVTILLLMFKYLLKKGESYSSYYTRTWFNFLMNIYDNLSFSFGGSGIISDEDVKFLTNRNYDKKHTDNFASFSGNVCGGNFFDLKLIDVREVQKKSGGTYKRENKFFDGFCLRINVLKKYNLFRGNLINILSDETLFSLMTEDTLKGIYESDKEFSFNSEELNKSFDCKISGHVGFNDVDEMHMQVHKIITPSFEEHLLYLRERYNTFSMKIMDSGLTFAVNMDRSILQKMKHGELLDLTVTYREANVKFRKLTSDLNGIEDFAYYNVFPFLERLYLIKYLTYLYLSYMEFDNYYNINNSNITSFEESMRTVFTMDNKEFRKLYTEEIKLIKKQTKEFAVKFEKQIEKEI